MSLKLWNQGGSGLCARPEEPASLCGVAEKPKGSGHLRGEGPCVDS